MAAPGGEEVLVQFKAGKMKLEEGTARPDTRRGLVRVVRMHDDLVYFQWQDRISGTVEDDFILFPGDAQFNKVEQTNQRVYKLRFASGGREVLFWMQEPNTDADADVCTAVNAAISAMQGRFKFSVYVEAETPGSFQSSEVQHEGADTRMEDSATTTTPQHSTPASSAQPDRPPRRPPPQVGYEELQNILAQVAQQQQQQGGMSGAHNQPQNIHPDQAAAALSAAAQATGGHQQQQPGPSLADVLTPEVVLPMLQDPEMHERLAAYLPDSMRSPQAMADLVQSPQFRSQLESFTQVLQSGRLDLTQFGIDPDRYGYRLDAFLQAIQDQAEQARAGQSGQQESGNDASSEGRPGQDTEGADKPNS
eukprot:jgi/Chlat1/8703/Chrsp88S08070